MKIGVVGAGVMGSGIAQIFSMYNHEVVMRDIEVKFVERGFQKIRDSLSRFLKKKKITEKEMEEILERIMGTTNLEDLKDCDLIVEAIVEDKKAKIELFSDLDRIVKKNVIFATNTSSISITELASVTERPEKFIGMHFFNPVPVMKLVEVVRGLQTSKKTFEFIWNLAKEIGKVPAEAKDFPGFISNRILCPMINEAIFALYEGVGRKEDIDTVMKLGMNHPLGPLELADLIGLDVVLSVLEVLFEGYKDPKYRPCPLLVKMVKAGYLGRKTGRGFYKYER